MVASNLLGRIGATASIQSAGGRWRRISIDVEANHAGDAISNARHIIGRALGTELQSDLVAVSSQCMPDDEGGLPASFYPDDAGGVDALPTAEPNVVDEVDRTL